ncbi:glycosyltransferase family 2 protein [Verrucomicrobiota bacterium]
MAKVFQKDSVSIVVPALNEETHLAQAVEVMIGAAESRFEDYEILVFDDGSTDRTGEIADKLAARHEKVQAFHNRRPTCLGGVIREGYRHARMEYAIWVDGKGATPRESLDRIFERRGEADLVIPYATNARERNVLRRFVSRSFRTVLNVLFRLDLKHYTHSVLVKTSVAKRFCIGTNSYAYQAEALIRMLRAGHTYVQVGVRDVFDNEGRSTKAFQPRNVIGVCGFVLRMLWEVYVKRGR